MGAQSFFWKWNFAAQFCKRNSFCPVLPKPPTRSVFAQQSQWTCHFVFLPIITQAPTIIVKNLDMLRYSRTIPGSISGLVVKFPLAMREPRVRFPADASFFMTNNLWRWYVFLTTAQVTSPSSADSISAVVNGRLAQLVERTLSMREVVGSKPTMSTLFSFFFLFKLSRLTKFYCQ